MNAVESEGKPADYIYSLFAWQWIVAEKLYLPKVLVTGGDGHAPPSVLPDMQWVQGVGWDSITPRTLR